VVLRQQAGHRMRKALLLLGLWLAAAAVPARADERILSWHSHIEVEKSGDLVVTETIKVRAEGKSIKRGIYRDIPLLPEDRFLPLRKLLDLPLTKPFDVVSVKRDGKKENYRIEKNGEWIRIRIGRADVFLKPAPYTYQITYRTGGQLSFEKDRDILYWDVNGTHWGFPADKVTATVTLPEGIKGSKVGGSTGKHGEQGKDYKATITKAGATITATRPFRAGENLAVVLEWPPKQLDAAVYGIRKPLPTEDPRSAERPVR
jgi:hypothetical protein